MGEFGIGVLNVGGPGFDDRALGVRYTRSDRQFYAWASATHANHAPGETSTEHYSLTAQARYGTDAAMQLGVEAVNRASGLTVAAQVGQESGSDVQSPRLAQNFELSAGIQRPWLQLFAGYRTLGPQYDPIDGYTQFNDARGPYVSINSMLSSAERSIVKTYSLFAYADQYMNRDPSANGAGLADVTATASVTLKSLVSLTASTMQSELRSYDQPYPPYEGGVTRPFDSSSLSVGYKDGTDSPIDLTYSWGPFSTYWLSSWDVSASRQVGRAGSVGLEYAFNLERPFGGDVARNQSLGRISIARAIGPDESVSLSLRTIAGGGGFSSPGTNLSVGYHKRYRHGAELFVNYGSPAAVYTLHRAILKYVFHFGEGGVGS